MDQLIDGTYAADREMFRPLYNSLLNTLSTSRAMLPVPDASLLAVEICSDTSAAAKVISALDTL